MSRNDLKEIISRVVEKIAEEKKLSKSEAPAAACFWGDCGDTCDSTTKYAVGEEA